MEEYLIFAAIGGLLFLTLFVNSVSEAYEEKQREKRIKILKIKQGLDELSDLLEAMSSCDINNDIRDLFVNEIMSRLQIIQKLDKHFKGIQSLLQEASSEQAHKPQKTQNDFSIKDEAEFKKKLIMLGRVIRILNSYHWYTNTKKEQLEQFIKDIKLLRCEKIFQFYSDSAAIETENKNFLVAKERYYYILHALKGSGMKSHPRVAELLEQAEFMLDQTGKLSVNNAQSLMEDDVPAEGADETDTSNTISDNEDDSSHTEKENPSTDQKLDF